MNIPPRWLMVVGFLVYGSLAIGSITHPKRSISGDSPEYLRLSKDLGVQTFRLPGYPLFLRACKSVRAAIAVQCLIGLGLIFLAWHFFYEWGGGPGALFGTLFLCFEFTVMMHQRMILSESIFVPVLTMAVGFGIRNRLRAALCFGILAMIHPTGLIAGLVFVGVCVYKDWKSSLLVVILLLGLPFGWVCRNDRVTGHPVYTSDGGHVLLLCVGRYLDPTLDESRTPDPAITTIQLMANHPWGTINYFLAGAFHLLIGSGVDMLFVRPYTPHGLLALLREHPLLWPLQIFILTQLVAGYSLFAFGLVVLWNSGHRDEACFLGISFLTLLASGSVEGYYRWRLPLMPYLATGIACGLSFLPE